MLPMEMLPICFCGTLRLTPRLAWINWISRVCIKYPKPLFILASMSQRVQVRREPEFSLALGLRLDIYFGDPGDCPLAATHAKQSAARPNWIGLELCVGYWNVRRSME